MIKESEILSPLDVNMGKGDTLINENYMGIDGLLYFKCKKCKCWCVYTKKQEHGKLTCSFCENTKKE